MRIGVIVTTLGASQSSSVGQQILETEFAGPAESKNSSFLPLLVLPKTHHIRNLWRDLDFYCNLLPFLGAYLKQVRKRALMLESHRDPKSQWRINHATKRKAMRHGTCSHQNLRSIELQDLNIDPKRNISIRSHFDILSVSASTVPTNKVITSSFKR